MLIVPTILNLLKVAFLSAHIVLVSLLNLVQNVLNLVGRYPGTAVVDLLNLVLNLVGPTSTLQLYNSTSSTYNIKYFKSCFPSTHT